MLQNILFASPTSIILPSWSSFAYASQNQTQIHTISTIPTQSHEIPHDYRLRQWFDLIFVLLLNGSMVLGYSRHTATRHFSWQKDQKKRRINAAILMIHIFAGLAEILRWHIRALSTDLPHADLLDVILCALQCSTNLALVKYMTRGFPVLTRPSYQAGAPLRMLQTLVAWYFLKNDWHRASVKAVNAFGYARLLIWLVGPLMKNKEGDVVSEKAKYNLGIFCSAIMAISEGCVAYAVAAYVTILVLIAALNRWTTVEMAQPCHDWRKKMLLDTLAWAGFMELEGLRRLPGCEEPRPYEKYADDDGGKVVKLL